MTRRVDPFVPPSPLDETEPEILELIETGKKRGYLTYEELNTAEPEKAPCPAMMDRILQTLDLEEIEVWYAKIAEKYPATKIGRKAEKKVKEVREQKGTKALAAAAAAEAELTGNADKLGEVLRLYAQVAKEHGMTSAANAARASIARLYRAHILQEYNMYF